MEPSQEDQNRNRRIVNEVLAETGHNLDKAGQPQTDEDKAIRRLEFANKEVSLAVAKYYEDHPIATDVQELRKKVMQIYMLEFSRWNKEDCIFMLTMMQSANAMKKFGY